MARVEASPTRKLSAVAPRPMRPAEWNNSRRLMRPLAKADARSRSLSNILVSPSGLFPLGRYDGRAGARRMLDDRLGGRLVSDQARDHATFENSGDRAGLHPPAGDRDHPGSLDIRELDGDRPLVDVGIDRPPRGVQELAQHLAHRPCPLQLAKLLG